MYCRWHVKGYVGMFFYKRLSYLSAGRIAHDHSNTTSYLLVPELHHGEQVRT